MVADHSQHIRGYFRREFHDARHRTRVRMAHRVRRIERPGNGLPADELRVELLGASYIAGHQLMPDKSATHIDSFHNRISVEWDE